MMRLIIFAIIILWIVINIARAKVGKKEIPADDPKPKPKKLPGRKYSWAWMQAAGALGLKFIRPEAANGYPAISGTVNGIEVSVQCLPPVPFNDPVTMFGFRFPQPAQIGMKLLLADPAEHEAVSKGKKSQSLQGILNERKLTDYYLEVKNPELFKLCFPRESLDRLGGMSVIYPWILLTDSGLQVRAQGIREDALNFQRELTVLLEIAEGLADFAWNTADRTKSQERGNDQPKAKPETKQETEPPVPQPEKKIAQETVPSQVEVKSSGPADKLEKSVFIHALWSTGNAAEQKEQFEKYRNSEVEWSGVLKSFYPFTSDFTFGSKPGVKAVFELEEFKPEGSFMPVKIKAVAAFPKDAAERFDHSYGKNFSFRGRLLKLEPIGREIYLADACLSENGDQI